MTDQHGPHCEQHTREYRVACGDVYSSARFYIAGYHGIEFPVIVNA